MPVIKASFDLIRSWESRYGEGWRLELYDTYQQRYGKDVLAYRFFQDDTLIFEGADLGCSPMHAIDSDASVAACLCFLSLKPGDTDPEYFDDYTEEQLAWAERCGEELHNYVEELDGR